MPLRCLTAWILSPDYNPGLISQRIILQAPKAIILSFISRPHVLACALYVVLYAALLVETGGLPYVMDNNESFSSLWHARNLFEYGLSGSFGLADEAFSPHEPAHPYVHTHQGNFPRLFAYVIYVLGARSIESQIAVTTFTVGFAAIWLIYALFARISTPWFAFTVSAVFMTDYVLFAQWHVVTYRVWHAFLLFGGLFAVYHAARSQGLRWCWAVALLTACLFYFELVFAAFVATFCFLFAVVHSWRNPKQLAYIVLAQSLGAALALAVFFAQAIAYLGVDGFWHDIYITFLARNDFPDAERLAREAAVFYESRKVIFWFNIGDRGSFAGLGNFVRSFTNFDWRIHTPMLSMAVWLVCAGWLLGLYPWRAKGEESVSRRKATLIYILLFVGTWIFIENVDPTADAGVSWLGIFVAGALTVLARLTARRVGDRKSDVNLGRALIITGAVLGSAGLLFALRSWPFDQYFRLLWTELRARIGPPEVEIAILTAAVIVAGYLAVVGAARTMGETARARLVPVLVYLICGTAAYAVVYKLSAGYIFSGYLTRHAPFTVFLTDVVVAVAFYVAVKVAAHTVKSTRFPALDAKRWTVLSSYSSASFAAVSVALAAFFVIFWAVVQVSYVKWLPPSHYAFLKTLAEPPYEGASFVVDNYAAPVAAYTGQWAYYEPGVLRARIDHRGALRIPAERHNLWLADRDTNAQYQRPQYYVCMIPQTMWTVRERIAREQGGFGYPGCSTRPLVRFARFGGTSEPSLSVVVSDQDGPRRIGFDSWAIVRLRSSEEADDRGIILDWSRQSAISRPVQPAN